jgi:hypothetical protein
VEGLRAFRGTGIGLSRIEETYATHLGKWGKVAIPPPPYVAAVEEAIRLGLPLHGLDFDEEAYSALYVEHVTGMRMIVAGVLEQGLADREFRARDQFEFALEWDRASNPTKGHRELEAARERRMAREIGRLSHGYDRMLAVVEFERLAGIGSHLEDSGAERLAEF